MSISEKANDLLNKFGSTQFDSVIWNTQDNLVARDKARQEISDYIAELEALVERLIEAIELGREVPLMHEPEITVVQLWYQKMHAIVREWKERD